MRKSLLPALAIALGVSAQNENGSSTSTGDSVCVQSICVSATLHSGNSTLDYVVRSTESASEVGWIGIGFGSRMAGSPMIVMWANSDGSMTLSQRLATGHFQPSVQQNPARVATASPELSTLTGDTLQFAFSIPLGDATEQNHIFAVSSTRPSSSAVNANIVQHHTTGTFTLNYEEQSQSSDPGNTEPGNNNSGNGTGNNNSGNGTGNTSSGSSSEPYTRRQGLIIAHAVLASTGFLVILPLGALLARWLRTFTRGWFNLHWFLQAFVAGPLIIAGVAIGINQSSPHLNDEHKKWGIALFVLYFAQCLLGVIIHYVKPKSAMTPISPRRPVQNYVHAIIGLLVLALSFRQVHSGYTSEWRLAGRGPAPNGVAIAFWVWLGVVAGSYVVGLALLRRQFKQEKGTVGQQDGGRSDPQMRHHGEY